MAGDEIELPVKMWHAQYGMHMIFFVAVAAHHMYSATAHPRSAHTVIAVTFASAAVRRSMLHSSEPSVQERLHFISETGLLAVACPLVSYALDLTVPATSATEFYAILIGFVAINFTLMLTGFPLYPKLMLVSGHFMAVFIVEPPPSIPLRTARAALFAAVVCAIGLAQLFSQALQQISDSPGPSPPSSGAPSPAASLTVDRSIASVSASSVRPLEPHCTHIMLSSSTSCRKRGAGRVEGGESEGGENEGGENEGDSSWLGFAGVEVGCVDGRRHLFDMIQKLKSGNAQLLDVREAHETARGVLRAATVFPLSHMTDGSMPLPYGLSAHRLTYIYCARGVRVHPAADMLRTMGFEQQKLVPLAEGIGALAAFGIEVGAWQLGMRDMHAPTVDAASRSSSGSATASHPSDTTSSESTRWASGPGLSAQLDHAFAGGRVHDLSSYDRCETLGHGSFAQVFLLRHRESGKLVVSKQMAVSGLSDGQHKRLATEVAVQASLRHELIVELSGFYEAQGQLCILMQYAPGGTLHSYLAQLKARGRVLDVDLFLRMWLSQIATAMAYVHSRRVLHRDLSSTNIFLDGAGNALIGDFGLSHRLAGASIIASLTCSADGSGSFDDGLAQCAPKTQCGTPTYMSPELIQGEPYGEASDVWAFGILLVEMMTLRLPFLAPSLGGVISAVLAGEWNAEALGAFEASAAIPEMKALVCADALLHPDPMRRMPLKEVLRRFPLQSDDEDE